MIFRYFHLRQSIRSQELQLASIKGAEGMCAKIMQHYRDTKEAV